MRVLALATDLYGINGGIAEYNRFFIKALSECRHVEKIVVLPRRSKQSCDAIIPRHSSIWTAPNTVMRDTVVSRHSREGGNRQVYGSAMETVEDDKRVTVLKERPNKWQYALSAVVALMTKGPFDLIWCGHLYTAPLAALLGLMSRAQFWLQIYGVEAWQRPSKPIQCAVKRASQILCVSRYSRKNFLGWSTLAPEITKVLPGTYDHQRFYPGTKNNAMLKQFGGEGKKILLTVGRLAAGEMYKGHETVIRLLPTLLRKDSRWVYWIAGDGDDRVRLETLARTTGVHEQVGFLGYVEDERLPDLYRTADVFIMLSRGEGFGIVYLEAMACGLPVIAAQGDGSADSLLDGRAGRLVGADCPSEVMQAIDQSSTVSREQCLAPRIFKYDHFFEYLDILFEKCLKHPIPVAQ